MRIGELYQTGLACVKYMRAARMNPEIDKAVMAKVREQNLADLLYLKAHQRR